MRDICTSFILRGSDYTFSQMLVALYVLPSKIKSQYEAASSRVQVILQPWFASQLPWDAILFKSSYPRPYELMIPQGSFYKVIFEKFKNII